jgi:hypothetical protein
LTLRQRDAIGAEAPTTATVKPRISHEDQNRFATDYIPIAPERRHRTFTPDRSRRRLRNRIRRGSQSQRKSTPSLLGSGHRGFRGAASLLGSREASLF